MKIKDRSTKWTFLIYQESTPVNYLDVLDSMQVPYILSPWHDKDIDSQTGELKKAHKHGALFFETLKSYSQVSTLISTKLNGPAHVEIVMSPKGMYNYFTHAENPEKTAYAIKDIECGSGFDLTKFLADQNTDVLMQDILETIEEKKMTEFEQLVDNFRTQNPEILRILIKNAYFFSKYLDSKRHNVNSQP